MADANCVIAAVRRAALELRATPGRDGMVIRPQRATEIMVAGDLHGNLANLKALLQVADLEHQPSRHLILQEFVHGRGRYTAGGDTSHQLLDVVAGLKCRFPNQVHLLMGNHEHAEWTGRAIVKDNQALNQLFAQGVATAYSDRAGDMLAAYADLYASMPLAVQTDNRVFVVHSIPSRRRLATFDFGLFKCFGVSPEQRDGNSSLHSLLWGRDVSEETSERFAELVECNWLVTGHVACPDTGFATPNRRQIIVDCVGAPAAYVLIPTQAPLNQASFFASIRKLGS